MVANRYLFGAGPRDIATWQQGDTAAAVEESMTFTSTTMTTDGASRKRRRPIDFDFLDQVTVIVGAAQKKVAVPVEALKGSGYFQGHLDFNTKIGGSDVQLESVEPSSFNVYLNWAMTRMLPKMADCGKEIVTSLEVSEWWMLGDFLQDIQFCNHVVEAFYQKNVREMQMAAPGLLEACQYVWAKTPSNCPLRQIILDKATWWDDEALDSTDCLMQDQSSFLLDLSKHWRKRSLPVKLQNVKSYQKEDSEWETVARRRLNDANT